MFHKTKARKTRESNHVLSCCQQFSWMNNRWSFGCVVRTLMCERESKRETKKMNECVNEGSPKTYCFFFWRGQFIHVRTISHSLLFLCFAMVIRIIHEDVRLCVCLCVCLLCRLVLQNSLPCVLLFCCHLWWRVIVISLGSSTFPLTVLLAPDHYWRVKREFIFCYGCWCPIRIFAVVIVCVFPYIGHRGGLFLCCFARDRKDGRHRFKL